MTLPEFTCDNCKWQRDETTCKQAHFPVCNEGRWVELPEVRYLCVALPAVSETHPGRPACSLYQPRAEA